MKINENLASSAKYKTPMQMNYSSPAKEGGADRLAHSQAKLNEQQAAQNTKDSIASDDAEIKKGKINVITGTPL